MTKIQDLLKNLGPGILFATTAIGTSHLVLSTKAGAQYGLIMVIPIILAMVLKYPFFEFGIRYTNVTNKSLIEGYRNRGKNYLRLYAGITLVTTFTILSTLYVVTAGLFINLLHIPEVPLSTVALGLFIFVGGLLIIGRYKILELSLKFVIFLLFIALLVTTSSVLFKGQAPTDPNFVASTIFNEVGVLFLISLVGWMPCAVEVSSWVSLWSIEKYKKENRKPSLSEALMEFNLGYILTAILAIFFLIIGCMTLYGTGTRISGNAVAFADQLVNLFTTNIGAWTYIFIATAAFATMFGTCIAAHDALARVSIDILELLSPRKTLNNKKKLYVWGVVILIIINYTVIALFSANMGQLVAMSTLVAFVVAPVIGYMNLKNVMSEDLPATYRPKKGLRALTYLGILFLTLFAAYYCWVLLI